MVERENICTFAHRTNQALPALGFGLMLGHKVGGLFELDQSDIGQDATARYGPALGKERDHAVAKVFVYFDGARLIAKNIDEQCKRKLRAHVAFVGRCCLL